MLRWRDGSAWTPAFRPRTSAQSVAAKTDGSERAIAVARVDPLFAFAPAAVGALCALGAIVIIPQVWGESGRAASLLFVFWVVVPACALGAIRGVLLLGSTRFTLTSRRIVARYSLLSRRTHELLLDEVESTHARQDLLARAAGYGTIAVRGIGGLVLPVAGIRDALRFQGQIQQEVDGAVKRR